MRWSGYASSCKENQNGTLATAPNCIFGRLIQAVSSKCLELLLLACSVALSVSGCASMAPGIQFSKAEVVEGDDAKQVNPAIEPITPALVQSEQRAREQRALEDISALMQTPAPYRIGAGDVLSIVVWDHPELSATQDSAFCATGASAGSLVSWNAIVRPRLSRLYRSRCGCH